MLPKPNNFRYLNREGRWLDVHWSGLVLATGGALELLPSPALDGPPVDLGGVASPPAPSGVAVDDAGRTFTTVPGTNTVVLQGGCSSSATVLTHLLEGTGLAPLDAPRGLVLLDAGKRLALVDSGNHRILFFETVNFSLTSVWGQDDLTAAPQPGNAPGRYDTPWTVSTDLDGNLYVLDYGNARVQKLSPSEDPDTPFTTNLQTSVQRPGALAVSGGGDDVFVFVFNLDDQIIHVFDGKGVPRKEADGSPSRIPGTSGVLALAASASILYVGDNQLRSVLAYSRTAGYPSCGAAVGYSGPVAALALDASGAVHVAAGTDAAPALLNALGAYLSIGVLWSEAIPAASGLTAWSRLQAELKQPASTSIDLHYALSHSSVAPPVSTASQTPFSDTAWTALPNGITDLQLPRDKLPFLFVGAVFRSERTTTPSLTQMRVTFNDPGYLPLLPAIYRQPPSTPDFLARFLALFQSVFDDLESEFDTLLRYFSPHAAPADALPWLASWLATNLEQEEPISQIRTSIANAFYRSQWRGTAEGLRLALLQDAGVRANIVQPIANANVWTMPSDDACSGTSSTPTGTPLGLGATLSSMHPGPAVLDSTAQLDRSFLIGDDQYGEPLFDGLAYKFVVEVAAGDVADPGKLDLVRRVVEGEKPAHTMWQLSVLESTMRVGAQARIGIDSFIAGAAKPSALGAPGSAAGLRLSGSSSPRVGAVRLGQEFKLDQ